jgi:hypothetical protein
MIPVIDVAALLPPVQLAALAELAILFAIAVRMLKPANT